LIDTIRRAGTGWSKILGKQPDWAEYFSFDADGMNQGFVAFGAAVLIAIVLATIRIGFPPPDIMLLLVAGHILPLLALVLLVALVKRIVTPNIAAARLIVPGLFMLALMKLIEGVAVLIGVPLAGAILAITAILGFRLAQANGLTLAISIGFGLALFVLLAGLPIALYMLANAF
jgi:hypothetical protein